MKKISNLWVNHLSPKGKEREEFKQYLQNDSQITEALKYILLLRMTEIQDSMASENSYEKDWQFLQAHRNGKLELLNDLLRLIEHTE